MIEKLKKPVVLSLLLWMLVSLACNLPFATPKSTGLDIADEDLVVENFLIPGTELEMSYQVSEEGEAVFWLEEWPDFSPLSSNIEAGDQAVMEWDGVQFNGYGELDQSQTQALAEIVSSPYGQALPLIALEQACRESSDLSAQQLAALLYPWQVHLKYSPVDRVQETLRFLERSGCKDLLEDVEAMDRASIYIDEMYPFPVVIGFFPFDPEGAYEVDENASTNCTPPGQSFEQISLVSFNKRPYFDEIAFNEYGPCNTKCRGACGRNCTLNNCEVEETVHCVVNDENKFTGFGVKVNRYICGVHEGCIVHDKCYDWCNGFGCGYAFWSAWCRHGVREGSCDGDSFAKYGVDQSVAWARGNGPFEKFKGFDYTLEENYQWEEFLEDCPVEEDEELIYGVKPQKVVCEGGYHGDMFGISRDWKIEFWNVGLLGGEEYGELTSYFDGVDENFESKMFVDSGTFSGGPNGQITISGRKADGGLLYLELDEGISVNDEYSCMVLNPEAFDGWTGP